MSVSPIACLDVIPYQRISGVFNAGVVAFSKYGIQQVDFLINSGEASETSDTVTSMTYNDRVDVWEYWTQIKCSDYPDGPLTVNATVLGNDSGTHDLLQTLLQNNNSGTLDTVSAWVVPSGGGGNRSGRGRVFPATRRCRRSGRSRRR